MQRRTVVAAASAISISLVSAVVALGVNFGALGFAAPDPNPSNDPAEVAPVPTSEAAPVPPDTTGSTAESTPSGREDEDDAGDDDGGSEHADDDRSVFEENEHDD